MTERVGWIALISLKLIALIFLAVVWVGSSTVEGAKTEESASPLQSISLPIELDQQRRLKEYCSGIEHMLASSVQGHKLVALAFRNVVLWSFLFVVLLLAIEVAILVRRRRGSTRGI